MTDPSALTISLLSCAECRSRKVKCDRQKPVCGRCVKGGEVCRYPTARKRPVYASTSRPKLSELENRLVNLEGKLKNKDATDQRSLPDTPESLPGALSATGRYEQLPPQEQIEELTSMYFARIHPDSPMLHQQRYISSLYLPPHMQPPMCLQYAVMAIAATTSPVYTMAAEAYYRRARHYVQVDELKEDGCHVTLGHAQCWILIGHFEAQKTWFSRASMSTARGVRLCQLIGLHMLDAPFGSVNEALPPPRDWCEREERRRTFWVSFCTDRGTSSTGGWPALLDVNRLQTRLPASEEAFQSGIQESTPTLKEALTYTNTTSSAFAHRIIAMHLYHECYNSSYTDIELDGIDDLTFWNTFQHLDNSLTVAMLTLPENLQCPGNVHDSTAVLINLHLYTATICLYRTATSHASQSNTPPIDANSKIIPAAQAIVTIIALVGDINAHFRNPFIAFAAFTAGFVFLRDYLSEGNQCSWDKAMALMDVMADVGEENPLTASLAVQMAHELVKTGADPGAIGKVRKLMDKMDLNTPVLGRENQDSATLTLCPLEGRFGRSPITEL